MAVYDVNEAIAIAHNLNIIDDEEFALLEFENRLRGNLDIPYWQYEKFDLDRMNNDECRAEFRFEKRDIFNLKEIFNFPGEIIMYNRLKIDATEAICMLLKRFAYPCRYLDMIPRFARPTPEICIACNTVMHMLYQQWGFLLNSFNRVTLSPVNLQRYANAVHERGAPLRNCWCFIDGNL